MSGPIHSSKAFIIPEEEHLANIESILNRDFFPAVISSQPQAAPQLPSFKLNNYLENFRSDENQVFSKIIDNSNKEWKERFWWLHQDQRKEQIKKLMIKGDQHPMIMGQPQQPRQRKSILSQQTSGQKGKGTEPNMEKKIIYENTRFDNSIKHHSATQPKTDIYHYDYQQISTPLLYGLTEETVDPNKIDSEGFKVPSKKRIIESKNGYKLITLPSPSASMMESPLMTYGQIESTPQRLPEYQIPTTPARDIILQQLNKKITQSNRVKKESAVMKLLSSTPISSMIKRRQSSFVRKSNKQKEEEKGKGKREGDESLQGLLNI